MKGDGVFKWAVRAMVDATHNVLEQAGCTLGDVALIIPHQANIRIIEAVAERLEIPRERVVVNLDRYGNTSSATIPIAYDEVVREKKVKPGDLVLFGGGFTWGSVLLKHAIKL
jgi:3-oxoacyl-[acyl-carrier-protein] synthase-3